MPWSAAQSDQGIRCIFIWPKSKFGPAASVRLKFDNDPSKTEAVPTEHQTAGSLWDKPFRSKKVLDSPSLIFCSARFCLPGVLDLPMKTEDAW